MTKRSVTAGEQSEVYEFDYEMEAEPSMRPLNGIPTDNPLPRFEWSRRVTGEPVGTVYRFELDEYHDFGSTLRIEADTLKVAQYLATSALGMDSVYYWRYLTSHNNGVSYVDTSLTFAVYMSRSCCEDRVGDANGSNEPTDEITLGDIMLMVDVKFISGDCSKLPCLAEADVNQDGGANPNCDDHVTLGDIMTLVDFLFITGPENATLPECL